MQRDIDHTLLPLKQRKLENVCKYESEHSLYKNTPREIKVVSKFMSILHAIVSSIFSGLPEKLPRNLRHAFLPEPSQAELKNRKLVLSPLFVTSGDINQDQLKGPQKSTFLQLSCKFVKDFISEEL